MQKRFIGRAVVAAILLGALGTGAPPAHAASSATAEYTGTMTISPGLVATGIRTASFSLASNTCTDVTTGPKKANGTGPCAVTMSGTITGTCASYTGTAAGFLFTHDGHRYERETTIIKIDGLVYFEHTRVRKTSSGQTGAGTGVIEAVASASTGGIQSCLTATGATRYDILLGTDVVAVV